LGKVIYRVVFKVIAKARTSGTLTADAAESSFRVEVLGDWSAQLKYSPPIGYKPEGKSNPTRENRNSCGHANASIPVCSTRSAMVIHIKRRSVLYFILLLTHIYMVRLQDSISSTRYQK